MSGFPGQKDLEKLKFQAWGGVFFFGIGLYIVPDWKDQHTITGAIVGFILFITLVVYSYRLQWRKRLSKTELSQGWRQQSNFRRNMMWPIGSIGLIGTILLTGSYFEAYANGAVWLTNAVVTLCSITIVSIKLTQKEYYVLISLRANKRELNDSRLVWKSVGQTFGDSRLQGRRAELQLVEFGNVHPL